MFPITPILDDFNRADENPIVGYVPIGRGGNVKIVSNQATAATSDGQVYRNSPLSSNDHQAYITVANVGNLGSHFEIVLRDYDGVQNFFYEIAFNNGDPWFVYFRKYTGAFTQIGTNVTIPSIVANDIVGASVGGSKITAFLNGVELTSVYDTTITLGRYIGFGCGDTTLRLDNFGGGTNQLEVPDSCASGLS